MSPKARLLLAAAARPLGVFFCVKCADIGANQPAAQKRELKVKGFDLGQGVQRKCAKVGHGQGTHYRLVSLRPRETTDLRASYTAREQATIKTTLGDRDAYLGHSSGNLETDHRTPRQRCHGDEAKIDVTDAAAVVQEFCPLTREHNLVKDRKCTECVQTGKRPPFLGISFYFEGNEEWNAEVGCGGCGWAHPEKWKRELMQRVQAAPTHDAGRAAGAPEAL